MFMFVVLDREVEGVTEDRERNAHATEREVRII